MGQIKQMKINTATGLQEVFPVTQMDAVNETTEYKRYTATEKTKLAGIETGADVNKIEVIKVNNVAQTISSKAVNIAVPTDYIPLSQKGAANGVASLDSAGKVPSTQLPAYVSDVQEYASRSNFPATGKDDTIYIAVDTNITYRWSGTTYVEISSSLALGYTHTTAYYGDEGLANRTDINALKPKVATLEGEMDDVQDQVAILSVTTDGLQNGATKAGYAAKADKLAAAKTVKATGDVVGQFATDFSAATTTYTLSINNSVPTGTYSAVTVNNRGLVTAGGNIIEVGNTPVNLVTGGLFFEDVE